MRTNRKKILRSLAALVIATVIGLAIYADIESGSVVPVLMYHSISSSNTDSGLSTLFITPEQFEKQMKFLSEHHYNVVGPDKVVAYMTGREKMPPKTAAITVDDGLYDFYENAYLILKKYNMPATIFIITDRVGRPGYLGWEEIREISSSGLVTIGSHTKSHPWLPTISVDEDKVHEELVVSKEILEKNTGKKVEYICYPSGAFNDLIKESAQSAGYKGGFTTNPDRRSAINDIYAIRRIKMSSSAKAANRFILWGKISRYYAWFKERR